MNPSGLSFNARRNRWEIRKTVQGKQKTLGSRVNKQDALDLMAELGLLREQSDRSSLHLAIDAMTGVPPGHTDAVLAALYTLGFMQLK